MSEEDKYRARAEESFELALRARRGSRQESMAFIGRKVDRTRRPCTDDGPRTVAVFGFQSLESEQSYELKPDTVFRQTQTLGARGTPTPSTATGAGPSLAAKRVHRGVDA